MNCQHKIAISVQTEYLDDSSDSESQQHVFLYTITIRNGSDAGVRLLGRHWVITDGEGKTQEIRGEGVVGEQPHLSPGQDYSYSSYAIINTPVGSMLGSYQMVNEMGEFFDADIPTFRLANPRLIH